MRNLSPSRVTLFALALLLGTAGTARAQDPNGGDYSVLGGAGAPTFVLGRTAVKLDTAAYEASRRGVYVKGALLVKDLGARRTWQ